MRLESKGDHGAGSSFIRKRILPTDNWPRKQLVELKNPVRDANNRLVNNCSVIDLFFEIGGSGKVIRFQIVERLVTELIIGCKY